MNDLMKDLEPDGPIFMMMIGLPGSGKSTFCKVISDDAVVLSTDNWIEARAMAESTTYDAIWSRDIKEAANWCCEKCGEHHGEIPFVLTVHHIDYNPQNCSEGNLVALCQRCHLSVQGWRVQPKDRRELIKRFRSEGRQEVLL